MPIFFFNVFNGTGTTCDDEGSNLPDMAAARDFAHDSIRSIIAEEAREGRIDLNGHIEIVDAEGAILDRISYGDAFELRLSGDSA